MTRVAVVGAGAFGGWTALALARRGVDVTLVDAWGAGHARASSGGETRVLRHGYGERRYVEWAREALARWRAEERALGERLFEPVGVLWMVDEAGRTDELAREHLEALGVPYEQLAPAEIARRWPALDTEGIRWALYEPTAGFLHARRATRAVARAVEAAGGAVRRAHAARPAAQGPGVRIELDGRDVLDVDVAVYAPGPWLGTLFPELAPLVSVTRQEVFFFGTPAGDPRFGPPGLPVWADRSPRFWYGIPDPSGRGFKVGDDTRGPVFDPTTGDRAPTPAGVAAARAYLARRFPDLADAPLLEARVCQYTQTADDDFIVDRLPGRDDVWVVGGGSGHGFKHGPVLGEHVAAQVLGEAEPDAAFAIARFGGGAP